jgi:hypothetical protein
MYNPRPVPEKDFEANFENGFGIISGFAPISAITRSVQDFML